jgi:ABC-type transport system involved in cytochrome c biogenesis permease component
VNGLLPIVQRELLLGSRRPATYWTRFCTAALVGGVLFALALSTHEPPARVAPVIFGFTTTLTFIYALFAGVRYTADALSQERREGTLGLLFLTDLRGYDIVLGKLAITSLNALFGLLAVIPLLYVPVLMGGVSGGELWRVTIVLLNTLFFSLSAGMIISAFGVEERRVLLGTLLLIMGVTLGLPLCWRFLSRVTSAPWIEPVFLWPSPAYSLRISARGLFAAVSSDFWPCMWTIAGLSGMFIAAASLRLPRSLQEGSGAGRTPGRAELERARPHGSRLLVMAGAAQAYLWRVSRDGRTWRMMMGVSLGAGLFGLYTLFEVGNPARMGRNELAVFGSLGVHWLIKVIFAAEACRPLSEDKQTRALELLLCTGLQPREMIAAQVQRLRRLFALPVLVICFFNWWIADEAHDEFLTTAFAIGVFTLPADCVALRWTAVQFSLVSASYTRAVVSCLWRVLMPGAIAFFAMIVFMAGRNVPQSTFQSWLCMWAFGCVMYDVFLASSSRALLARRFRALAAGEGNGRKAGWSQAVGP